MAGIIKGQILKRLSKFTKNLSPDKIHVSTLKGEGELYNLELDEVALSELLDLPTWLTIKKGVCNRVSVKIQWTKLKSQPICVLLDEVEVEMETCEEIRTPISELPLSSQNINGKYGFAERILDGIYVSINSVVIHFKAKAFHASIQLSRIVVQSKTPTWENAFDLRLTRIKEELRGEVLIFKEAEWQTLRIEANALEGSTFVTTPLRLIANQSKARITIKKNLQDCTITASRLLVNLDDLLWVLTDSQLKAALSFVNSLKDIIQKSAQQSKLLAADKMKKQEFVILPNPTTAGLQQQSKIGSKSQQAITKVFEKYNVAETSYHLHSGRIDLHLCDESTFDKEVSLKKVEGGAIQMTFMKMWFDYYPYHPSGTERSQWLKYDENMASRDAWAQDLLKCFHDDQIKIQKVLVNQEASSRFNVKPLTDITQSTNLKITDSESVSSVKANDDKIKIPVSCEEIKISQLLENSLVFRLNDFVVYQVSSSIDSRNKKSAEKFLSSDKKTLWLPPEMSSLHIEYTDYYFSESKNPVSNI